MISLLRIEDLFDFLRQVYLYLREVIRWFLENTLFKAKPQLSEQFADPIILLCSLTAILLIFELISNTRKILAATVILGWTILIVSIILTTLI
jgi:hypothetical protein